MFQYLHTDDVDEFFSICIQMTMFQYLHTDDADDYQYLHIDDANDVVSVCTS